MYLDYKTTRYKDKIYKSYLIVESYREKGEVKKRPLWKIGKLTDNQVAQIKLICKSQTDKEFAVTELKNVIPLQSKPYLELAVVNELWNQGELSRVFRTNITKGDLPTPLVARVLTINRCVDPCSNYSIPPMDKKNRRI
ncbi:MAG: hypothetical protein AB1422_07775 [bacterium]